MHSHFGKIGLISLVLVLAMGMLGVGYAMWDKEVFVDGTVETGEVNMKILSVGTDDPLGTIDPYHGELIGGPAEPGYPLKDVATTTAWLNQLDDQRAYVHIEGGYPCYWVGVHFTAFNNGTVPVKYAGIISTAPAVIYVDPGDTLGEQIDPGVISYHVEAAWKVQSPEPVAGS